MSKNIGSKFAQDVKNSATQLINELKSGGSENFKEFLKFSSNFRKYSFRNLILIKSQMPKAKQVASMTLWNSLGRKVKKGETSIKIYGFSKYTKKVVDKKTREEKDQENVFFPIVGVFDVSQTEGEEIPTWSIAPEGNDDKGLYEVLKKELQNRSIEVIETELNGPLGTAQIGKIKICTSQGQVSKLVSLIHETAHIRLGHVKPDCKLSRQDRECQAEAAAYIVCSQFGLESTASVEYLLHWGNDEENFQKNLDEVLKVSQEILTMFGETVFQKQDKLNNQKYKNKQASKIAA